MIFKLPALETRVKEKQGFITKQLVRPQSVRGPLAVRYSNKIPYYIFTHLGVESLVLVEDVGKSITDKYQYILATGLEPPLETDRELILSDLAWAKHPLQKPIVTRRFTKASVLDSWKDAFRLNTDEEHGAGLRVPQVGALHAIQAHWTVSKEAGIVVMPTGTGKTDAMISCMVMSKINTLLVVVPTDPLRDQLAGKFLSLGILPIYDLVGDDCESPIVAQMKHVFATTAEVDEFFDQANVIIATMSVIVACDLDIQSAIAGKTSHLFIDEAHHTPAETWRSFKKLFTKSKVLLFTATPFRNDGK